MNGTELPKLKTSVPGPSAQLWIDRLALHECPAITARRARRAALLNTNNDDPIVWKEAVGALVLDTDGNRFLDLTAGFGVAAVGHRNSKVVDAAQKQIHTLLHAMGDAFPDTTRIELLEELAHRTGLSRSILGCSGSDAIDAALKTAYIATGRHRVLAFSNSYHGLAFGSLPTTDYKSHAFRAPFALQLGNHVDHVPFGGSIPDLTSYGAILVEPIQGRGGIKEPPAGWLRDLIDKAHSAGALVIFDEIYTGFGRTGTPFAFQHESLEGRTPDLLCVGKAMGGGFPISACIGSADVMDRWGASKGEAIHTQTFLGNPLGCAMALAALTELDRLLPCVLPKSDWLRGELHKRGFSTRGRGLMVGIEHHDTLFLSRTLMQRGIIVLPAGPNAEVLALTPPLMITQEQMQYFLDQMDDICSQ
jgi:4-aminobutyrate aminotransferase/(S)-3-amino-2-methylpropionate transaminase